MTSKTLRPVIAMGAILGLAQSDPGQRADMSARTSTATSDLFRELKALDAKSFDSIFKDCALGTHQSFLTEDFEFYHREGFLTVIGCPSRNLPVSLQSSRGKYPAKETKKNTGRGMNPEGRKAGKDPETKVIVGRTSGPGEITYERARGAKETNAETGKFESLFGDLDPRTIRNSFAPSREILSA